MSKLPEDWQPSLLQSIGRAGLSAAAIILFIVLSVVPMRFGAAGAARPAFMLMAVYYWSMLKPPPVLFVFLIGLLLDLLGDYYFGMNALVLVLAQIITARNRKFLLGQPFLVIWAGFVLVVIAAAALQWAVFSLFSLKLAAPGPALLSVLLSAALFPLVAGPLAVLYRAVEDLPDE